jgi:hypothetical protein
LPFAKASRCAVQGSAFGWLEQLSQTATGPSPGYRFSILKEGREPSIERTIAIADEVGVSLPSLGSI